MDNNPRSSSQRSNRASKSASPVLYSKLTGHSAPLAPQSSILINNSGAFRNNPAQQRLVSHGPFPDSGPSPFFSNGGTSTSSLSGAPNDPLVGHAETIDHPLWGGVEPPPKEKKNKKPKKTVSISQVTRIPCEPVQHSKEDEARINSLDRHLRSLIRHYAGDSIEVQQCALDFILPFKDFPPNYICDVVRKPGSDGIVAIGCILCPKEDAIRFQGRNILRRFAEHFVHDHLHIPEPFVCFKCNKRFGLPQTRDRHEQDVHLMYRPKAYERLLKNEESHSPAASPANTDYTSSSHYGSTPSHYAPTPSAYAPTPGPDHSEGNIVPPTPSPARSTQPLPQESIRPPSSPSAAVHKARNMPHPYRQPHDEQRPSGHGTAYNSVFLAPGPVNPPKGTSGHKRHESSRGMATRTRGHHDQRHSLPSNMPRQIQAQLTSNPHPTHLNSIPNPFSGQEQASFVPALSFDDGNNAGPTSFTSTIGPRYLQARMIASGSQIPAGVNPVVPCHIPPPTISGYQPTGYGLVGDMVGENYSMSQPRDVVGMRGPNQGTPYPPGYTPQTWVYHESLAAADSFQLPLHAAGYEGMQPAFCQPQPHNICISPVQQIPDMQYTRGVTRPPLVTGSQMSLLGAVTAQPSPMSLRPPSSFMPPTPAHAGGTSAHELASWATSYPNASMVQPPVHPSTNPAFF